MSLSRRGHSYAIDGVKVPSVTKLLGEGYPKPQLVDWAARESGDFVLNRWEELAAMQPSERYEAVRGARFSKQREAAVRGTQVHEYAQRLSRGETIDVPEPLDPYVETYLSFAAQWEPREIMVEQAVFSRRYGYGGTFDLIADLCDGARWLLDWKTTGKGVYPEAVLQLAAYRYAEVALGPEGEELPVPAVQRVGIVWLRGDGYDLVPIEADESAFRVFLYAAEVARFRSAERDDWIGDALIPPQKERSA